MRRDSKSRSPAKGWARSLACSTPAHVRIRRHGRPQSSGQSRQHAAPPASHPAESLRRTWARTRLRAFELEVAVARKGKSEVIDTPRHRGGEPHVFPRMTAAGSRRPGHLRPGRGWRDRHVLRRRSKERLIWSLLDKACEAAASPRRLLARACMVLDAASLTRAWLATSPGTHTERFCLEGRAARHENRW